MKTKFRSFVYLGLPIGVALIFLLALFLALPGGSVVAAPEAPTDALILISEFQPNASGTDPDPMDFELSGPPSTAFDLWILSVESDSSNTGTIDRGTNVSGTFDTNGLAVVSIPDLENPSFTVILADAFTGTVGSTDIDTDDDGTADDLSTIGTVLDALGVPDDVADEALVYGAQLGGTDLAYNGQYEPLLAFRDGTTGAWYNTVTVDFGLPTEHIGVFDVAGTELDGSHFDNDPTASDTFNTFGSVNPSQVPFLISEFQPNASGTDPDPMDFELSGPPSADFDLWILSVESDSSNTGTIDRGTNVSGTFDTNGLAVVSIPDLENPSFTVILADAFTGTVGSTDIDTDDDGTADDLSTIGTVLDALGVPDDVADEALVYGAQLGGTDLAYNGQYEPLLAFRDGTTGAWYNTVTVDFGQPTEHIGVFDVAGTELDGSYFDNDPTASDTFNTFGAINPSFVGPNPTLINEFQPNASGTDPDPMSFELSGHPNADFDLWILSVESDSSNTGTIDRGTNVSGTFDTNGLAVVSIPDLENPSFTVILADAFTGTVGSTDIDTDDDGTADDLSTIGTVLDALGVPDDVADEALVYGAQLGGTDLAYNGQYEPLLAFRDGTNGDWYNTVTVDFGQPTEHIGVFDVSGTELDGSDFDNDPTASDTFNTFGTINPSYLPGADLLPTVSSTTPVDNATGVALDANITIDFSENVTVTGTWFDITCASSGAHTAVVSGGPQSFTLNPDTDFGTTEVCTVTVYAAQVTDQDGTADNMASDYVFDFTTLTPECGNAATFIHTIQGNGMSSPEEGNIHTVEGVVVGDFQTSDYLSGFFLQEEDVDADADPMTSEGIFIYDGSSPAVDVSEGEVVRVTGTVDEEYGLTRIESVSYVEVCPASGVASAATPSMPVANVDDWEWTEGMLVHITQTLYATEHYNLGRYGEISLSVNDRLFNPTQVITPGLDANTLQDLNDRSRIELNDSSTVQNPDPIIYPSPELSATNTLRGGDSLDGLTGALNYSFGKYLIEPVEPVTFTHDNPRTTAPDPVGGSLQVASFNVLNYFSTIDTGAAICGPSSNMDCRGADSASEFTRQRDKIISAILAMDVDIIGLMEIESHATDAAVDDLVDGLNAIAGAGTYAKVDTGPIGTDAIKVALIYQPANTTPVGTFAVLDDSFDPDYREDKNRPALAQTFAAANGAKVTVIVNHLKSKGSDCDALGDPDTGDGQGNCNLTRLAAANIMLDWLATDPTASGSPNFLIIGDLNSYAMEDPIKALEAGGFTDLYRAFGGDDYSYVFGGQWGTLDYSLASAALLPDVTGATAWHINGDEPKVLDYNEEYKSVDQITSLYAPDEYRASDHDPIIVGLDLKWRVILPLIFKSGN